ncbi:MAG: hypothetical protein AB1714_19375 [Acidobacteriota bacterium]
MDRHGAGFVLAIAAATAWASAQVSTPAVLEAEPSEESPGYYCYHDLPNLTMSQRVALARKAHSDWPAYCQEVRSRAIYLSSRLEKHIRSWLKGEASAVIPKGLLPPYIDGPKTHSWTLMRPEQVIPEKQWFIQAAAHEINPEYKRLYMYGASRHCTYVKLLYVAPIGCKLVVEGEFPHSRFMDFEILQPLDPEHPATGRYGEHPEVPLVDADIDPDPGNVNPFRAGADRNAAGRHYRVQFDLQMGNAVDLNRQAMESPAFRSRGNRRVGGPFGFAGPWGNNVFTPANLWYRIYAPDKNSDTLGGAGIPKALLQLPTGERFWLQPDATLAVQRQTTRLDLEPNPPGEPWPFIGPSEGWSKIFGLMLARSEANAAHKCEPWGVAPADRWRQMIRANYLLLFNRGAAASAPGCYESSATCCNYNSYLTRMFRLGDGMVYVITGKMPSTPKTRNGEPLMTKGEARMWSISQYAVNQDEAEKLALCCGGLMDDEITVNSKREYIIVYSRKGDRPRNAIVQNGVTWEDWGPAARHTLTIRWMSVMPEWHLSPYAPDEHNLPWETTAWSGERYDKSLVGENAAGALGPYHPIIHYMTRGQFEALGSHIDPGRIPKWE